MVAGEGVEALEGLEEVGGGGDGETGEAGAGHLGGRAEVGARPGWSVATNHPTGAG